MSSDSCYACETSIYETFGAGDEDHPTIEPARAALWAMLPGGGHFKTGQHLLGLAIAGLLIASVVFGAVMIGGNRRAIGLTLLLVGVAAWVVSSMDARHFAAGDAERILLRPRVVTSAMGLVFAAVIFAAILVTGDTAP